MKPLTVITGIILGSCLSIALSLAAVMLMFFVLGEEYPRVVHEFGALTTSLGIFTCMTAISAASFYSLLIGHRYSALAQLTMWLGLALTGLYFWL